LDTPIVIFLKKKQIASRKEVLEQWLVYVWVFDIKLLVFQSIGYQAFNIKLLIAI